MFIIKLFQNMVEIKKYLTKFGIFIKNILFFTAWLLFFMALFVEGLGCFTCLIFAFLFSKIYLLISKNDTSNQIIFKDKFYLFLKHIAFYTICFYSAKILYDLYFDIFNIYNDSQINVFVFILFSILYLYSVRACKDYKVYFKIYFVLFLAIVCAYWYYNDFIKQPNALITRILNSELRCYEGKRACSVLDKSIKDDINNQIKGKNYDEIIKHLKQYELNAYIFDDVKYFNHKLITKKLIIRLELVDDKIFEIVVFKIL